MAGLAECQFNTNCWVRGRMVAMTGDFSGTFSAELVEVASAVNIRNGAVSTYVQIKHSPPNPLRKQTLKVMEWTITQQPYDAVIDITMPMTINYAWMSQSLLNQNFYVNIGFNPRIRWSRNGVVLREDSLLDYRGAMTFFNSVRLLDFDVPANTTVIYKVELIDYYTALLGYENGVPIIEYGSGGPSEHYIGGSVYAYAHGWKELQNPYFQMWFKGKALIGIRKR